MRLQSCILMGKVADMDPNPRKLCKNELMSRNGSIDVVDDNNA